MTEEVKRPWSEWWNRRPWRPEGMYYSGMSSDERDEMHSKYAREYYATHKSARVARWVTVLGLLLAIFGFWLSFSLSALKSDAGYCIMIGGIVIAFLSFYFFSAFSRA